ADIPAAVVDMPNGRRKFFDVNVRSGDNILEHGTRVYDDRWNVSLLLLIMLEIGLTQLLLGQSLREAERHAAPFTGKNINQEAKALWAARHFVENNRRPVILRNDDIRGQSDIFLPGCTENALKFTQFISFTHPFAQIRESNVRLNLRTVEHDCSFPTYPGLT